MYQLKITRPLKALYIFDSERKRDGTKLWMPAHTHTHTHTHTAVNHHHRSLQFAIRGVTLIKPRFDRWHFSFVIRKTAVGRKDKLLPWQRLWSDDVRNAVVKGYKVILAHNHNLLTKHKDVIKISPYKYTHFISPFTLSQEGRFLHLKYR